MYKFFSILLFTSLVNFSFSQMVFTVDREKYIKDLQSTFSDFGKGDYNNLTKKQLPELFESGAISEQSFVKLVATSNLILEKKLKPYPELYNYVFSVVSLFKNEQNDKSFQAWHVAVDQMLNSRNVKRFEEFVELTSGFFDNRVVSSASNFTWFYEGGTFSFDFVDSPIIQLKDGNLVCRVQNKESRESKTPNPILTNLSRIPYRLRMADSL